MGERQVIPEEVAPFAACCTELLEEVDSSPFVAAPSLASAPPSPTGVNASGSTAPLAISLACSHNAA